MYVILDLEWNAAYCKSQKKYINEIIEFGAVKVDANLDVIDFFSALVKPQLSKRMNRVTAKLTGLEFNELMSAKDSFCKVAEEFAEFLGDSVLLTWGTTDVATLIENYKFYYGKQRLPFLKKYCNLQEYCMKCLGLNDPGKQLGVSGCAEILGIGREEEAEHRAGHDAMLELEIYKKLYDLERFERVLSKADCDEFYKKLFYKTTYITSLENRHVKLDKMIFNCPECGKSLMQETEWRVRSRGFVARFCCKNCESAYSGKYIYKKLYHGICVQSKLNPINDEKEIAEKEADLQEK